MHKFIFVFTVVALLAWQGYTSWQLAMVRVAPQIFQQKLGEVAKKLAAAELLNRSLAAEKKATVQATERVTRAVAARAARNAGRNLTAVAAEVLPYIGVAATLSVTALDLHDACQTIKEINELHVSMGTEVIDENRVCGMTVPNANEVISDIKSVCRKSGVCKEEVPNHMHERP